MGTIIEDIEKEQLNANAPEFNTGDTVKVYGKITKPLTLSSLTNRPTLAS